MQIIKADHKLKFIFIINAYHTGGIQIFKKIKN